jgi:hypothetical protein
MELLLRAPFWALPFEVPSPVAVMYEDAAELKVSPKLN